MISYDFLLGLCCGCILAYAMATIGILLQRATINEAIRLINNNKSEGKNGGIKPTKPNM